MEDRMQESASTSASDRGSGPAAAAGEPHENDQAAPARVPGRVPLRPRQQDPLTGRLTVAIIVVIILWLAGVLSALVFGVFNQTGAPRTQVEHDLASYSAQVQSGKANSETFAAYADALVRAGQFSKADAVLNQALKTARQGRSFLYAEQAKLFIAESEYQQSVTAADKAIAEADKELAAFKAANLANNRAADAGAVLPDSYTSAALSKARALLSLKDYAGAIKAFDADLRINPSDADVLVARGEAKAQTGDKTGAGQDFRAALKYVPDYQPALDGLKKIGATK
jgi:tetratricopeptide (TPR) repeat protein